MPTSPLPFFGAALRTSVNQRSLHASEDASISGNAIRLTRKPVARAGHLANHRPMDEVCERMYRDWLRGITERSLSATYGFVREAVEEIVREQAQITVAAARRAGAA